MSDEKQERFIFLLLALSNEARKMMLYQLRQQAETGCLWCGSKVPKAHNSGCRLIKFLKFYDEAMAAGKEAENERP